MVDAFYAAGGCPRKCARDAHNSTHMISEDTGAPVRTDPTPADLPRDLAASGHATPEVQAALLSAADQNGGVVDLDRLVAAIPDHPQPLSAILSLVDAGVLALDTAAPFGGDLRLWRTAL
ncbi:hypothetical protein ILT44_04195 [Microvirga sp. BT689]|uniref:hypothetical protein n=1 Tax=Microvirga arvi TaxID=2778731 RepID=UPI0019512787|nr:hypothetical protein [Microvirga arvi]MBM6579376.1 hypothetical protein [Microvirga arvi]